MRWNSLHYISNHHKHLYNSPYFMYKNKAYGAWVISLRWHKLVSNIEDFKPGSLAGRLGTNHCITLRCNGPREHSSPHPDTRVFTSLFSTHGIPPWGTMGLPLPPRNLPLSALLAVQHQIFLCCSLPTILFLAPKCYAPVSWLVSWLCAGPCSSSGRNPAHVLFTDLILSDSICSGMAMDEPKFNRLSNQ